MEPPASGPAKPAGKAANNGAASADRPAFPVVGIGASAGGIPALLKLLQGLPADPQLAIAVIMHLSASVPSEAAEVLRGATGMQVSQVTKTVRIEPNHVYVIPPGQDLVMEGNYLSLHKPEKTGGRPVTIDLFFRTLATVHKERAVAVVLSGSGSDGAVGISRIKEQGGVVIAQHPADAQQDGMPLAAIASAAVDFILKAAEIGPKLMELRDNMQAIRLPPADAAGDSPSTLVKPDPSSEAENALQSILLMLRSHTGHDFRCYKRATILRRLERRLQVRGVPDLPAYRKLLEQQPEEFQLLLKDLLIGVTNFFRDSEVFKTLENDVLPELAAGKRSDECLRIWVAGCSTGEEAYSLAMLLADKTSLMTNPPSFQIFASDIDESAIAIARGGVYPASIEADIPPAYLRQYFQKEGERYRIRKVIRDRVLFAAHNLLSDPPFSRLDMISCRNLLIYLNRQMQMHLLESFHFSLNPGGILVLGSSESADATANLFSVVDKKHRIYRGKSLARTARYAPSLPGGRVGRPADSVIASRPAKREHTFAEIHQRVLAQHAPPSVIVNHDSEILHMTDRAGRFLRHVGGEPTRNIVSLVQPELRLELRTALFQAVQSGKSVEARQVQIQRENRNYFVSMTVRPFRDDDAGADPVLVLFDEFEHTMSGAAEPATEGKSTVMMQLEEELQRTKQQLQDTIEHSEISNEELRASNEELQAINEELRSATEELETSKEELQSVNEELVTVNYELKSKVEESGKVNDDLKNLIASTDIATIFVDRGMRIKRYTPRATDIFNIIASDLGRSLMDITHKLDYPQLAEDAVATFDTLRPVEREVRSGDGRYYIVRQLPYRTREDRIEGAVMTFFDITHRREAEQLLRAQEEEARRASEEANAMKDEFLAALAREAGFTGNLPKPVSIDDMLELIRSLLKRGSA